MISADGYIGSTGATGPSGDLSEVRHSQDMIEMAPTGSGSVTNASSRQEIEEAPIVRLLDPKMFDVCSYIIKKIPSVGLVRLQLLAYYSYAWSLVWDERELFRVQIVAGPNGPVVSPLYDYYSGLSDFAQTMMGDSSQLSEDERATIDAVIDGYGKYDAVQLSRLARCDAPWRDARQGVESIRYDPVISKDSILKYYCGLAASKYV